LDIVPMKLQIKVQGKDEEIDEQIMLSGEKNPF
jgi:hypothetical protein